MSLTPPATTDRFLSGFRRLTMLSMPAIRFFCPWSYQVESVNGDGSVNASATDTGAGMPDLSHVLVLSGVAGTTVTPAVGATVIVAFLNGDPQQARVTGFDANAAQSVSFNGGTGTVEHLATIEGVVNLMSNLLIALGLQSGTGGAAGAATLATALAVCKAPATTQTLVSTMLNGATDPTGALSLVTPASLSAIASGLATKTNDGAGSLPNLGCKNLRGG